MVIRMPEVTNCKSKRLESLSILYRIAFSKGDLNVDRIRKKCTFLYNHFQPPVDGKLHKEITDSKLRHEFDTLPFKTNRDRKN